MATREYVIESVRIKVSDHKAPRVYDDVFYERAVDFALNKLNFDFGTSYIDVPSVPTQRVFLVIKLASIEMCYTRAGAIAVGDSAEPSPDSAILDSIEVPDLKVSGEAPTSTDSTGSAFWLSLADKLQSEYDGEKPDTSVDGVAEVSSSFVRKTSLTTGGFRSRKMDLGLDAVIVLATVSGGSVTLEWNILRDVHFSYYSVYRGLSPDMSDEERIAIIDDNQIVTHIDSGRPAGTYYYRVKTVNPNEIKTDSNTVAVVVV